MTEKSVWTSTSGWSDGTYDIGLQVHFRKVPVQNARPELIFLQLQSSTSCLPSIYLFTLAFAFACAVCFHQALLAAKSFILPHRCFCRWRSVNQDRDAIAAHLCNNIEPFHFPPSANQCKQTRNKLSFLSNDKKDSYLTNLFIVYAAADNDECQEITIWWLDLFFLLLHSMDQTHIISAQIVYLYKK